ncbi:hypothetical protein [Sphingobacterium faecium]|uniref:hypothetical protein n=1 Tax=Sphingobacterium faecium TaxID=34087 RepID=UPI00247AB230|nr:hypothetical protein [Sphingobacterium faecium]WGQ15543.1 hypothetical protein QG727_03845 [Sphingobacterium faecium]
MNLQISSIINRNGRSVDMKQFSIARAIMKKDNNWETVNMDDSGDLVLFRLLSLSEQKELQEKHKCFSNYTELNIGDMINEPVSQREPNHWY